MRPTQKTAEIRKKHSDGSSIYKGVSWDKLAKKWRAQINILGRVVNLGGFNDERVDPFEQHTPVRMLDRRTSGILWGESGAWMLNSYD